jgi:hypothetical protein
MLDFWVPHFETFAGLIKEKSREKCGLIFEAFRVFGFIDCSVIATCRPGGGPMEDGANAARWNNFIQMAWYNGWKKHHGIKYMSIELPIGFCMYLFGPK